MQTGVHELFINRVEDVIRSQLKAERGRSGREARFAQKVRQGSLYRHGMSNTTVRYRKAKKVL
jgi:hypothetical protein